MCTLHPPLLALPLTLIEQHDCPPAVSLVGVPVTRPVAGIAMGLILERDGRFSVLSDILGSEDALGDMDFKVAGDDSRITAFQMDIKVCGEVWRVVVGSEGQHAGTWTVVDAA